VTHFVADLAEAVGLNLLTAEHQHLFMAFQHLLCMRGHLPHGVLHIFADAAEAPGDDADRQRHNGSKHQQDQ